MRINVHTSVQSEDEIMRHEKYEYAPYLDKVCNFYLFHDTDTASTENIYLILDIIFFEKRVPSQ